MRGRYGEGVGRYGEGVRKVWGGCEEGIGECVGKRTVLLQPLDPGGVGHTTLGARTTDMT